MEMTVNNTKSSCDKNKYQNDGKIGFRFFKRAVDVCAGTMGLIVLIPVTLVVFLANLVTKDNGPVIYTQNRIGKDGKIFKMYKFRSMCVGAEETLKKYLAENSEAYEEYKVYKKLKNDPRITTVGKFLRKTSLDEIPQFLNLLNGTMSLVGPRPYMPHERQDMGDFYDTIIKNKPGITGLWQTSGRSNTTFDERLVYDADYDKKKSVLTDFKIIVKTFVNVFKKDGAV